MTFFFSYSPDQFLVSFQKAHMLLEHIRSDPKSFSDKISLISLVSTLIANVSFSFKGKPTTEVRDTAMFPSIFLNLLIFFFYSSQIHFLYLFRRLICCLNISEVSPSDSLISLISFASTLIANVPFYFRIKPTTEVRDTAMFP